MNLNEYDSQLEADDSYLTRGEFSHGYGPWYQIQTSVVSQAHDTRGGRKITRSWKPYARLHLLTPRNGGLSPQEILFNGDLDELRKFHEQLGEAIDAADEMYEARMRYQHRRDNP